MKLLCDITGVFKMRAYAAAGDEVDLISDHGNVLIVQSSDGLRFPVERGAIESGAQAPAVVQQRAGAPRQRTATKQKAAKRNDQGTLF